MIPAAATSESVRVDLPWSTWAITDMDRMFNGFSWIFCSWAIEKFTILEGGGVPFKDLVSVKWRNQGAQNCDKSAGRRS